MSLYAAIVEKGKFENTIDASGEVLLKFEGIITSPDNAAAQSLWYKFSQETILYDKFIIVYKMVL